VNACLKGAMSMSPADRLVRILTEIVMLHQSLDLLSWVDL
jgi:hypothetical protein